MVKIDSIDEVRNNATEPVFNDQIAKPADIKERLTKPTPNVV